MLVLFDFLLMGVCKVIKSWGSKMVYEGKFGLDRGGVDRKEVAGNLILLFLVFVIAENLPLG